MAEASDPKWRVIEIGTCPICMEVFKNMRMLPCVHAICLECLQSHCKDKVTGIEATCPVCRKKFQILDAGVEALPDNFFEQNLMDAGDASSQTAEEVLCEVCVAASLQPHRLDEDEHEIEPATVYCTDCNLKLCRRCSRSCCVKARGGPHQVRPIGAELTAELIQQCGSYCDQHKDERLKLYCHDCEINVCHMCFSVDHIGHKCANIGIVASEIIEQFNSDIIMSISSHIDDLHAAMVQVDSENSKFVSALDEKGIYIQKRWEAVNQVTEKHVNQLMQELQMMKSDAVNEADNRSDELELAVTSLESFQIYLVELMTKGSPCDITRAAKTMHSRASELLQTYVIPGDYRAPDVVFTPTNIDELTYEGQNLIGRISLQTSHSGTIIYLSYT